MRFVSGHPVVMGVILCAMALRKENLNVYKRQKDFGIYSRNK